tara:strand:- start:2372 stop:2533 length:162 start_codon:yes stop_codon:yes gene_type:complete
MIMNEDVEKILKRLQRKIEIVRDDQKRSGSPNVHHSGEMLTLLDMLRRKLGEK